LCGMELIQDITEHILILKCKEALNRGEEFSSPKIRKNSPSTLYLCIVSNYGCSFTLWIINNSNVSPTLF
jgi:hypothetical protein